jgi:tetratricopeptide (TPR) repeat protein
MKKIFFVLLLLSSMLSFAQESATPGVSQPVWKTLDEKKFHYSALNEFFKETYNAEISKEDLGHLEDLLYYTGIEILEDYEPSLLNRYPTSSTRFILGRQQLREKNIKRALEYFSKIHPDHRFYPESKLLEAQVYALEGNMDAQFNSFETCWKTAEKSELAAPTEKIKRYFRMVYEICLVNKARHHYKKAEFQAALDAYNKVPKSSYKWPYLILEKAWVYYQLGDFNRTLGLLVTYKSPLLDTYFFPEAEYLASLAYFRLCLYDDTLVIIDQYYTFYRPRFAALESVLRKNVSSQNYFYNLMFKPGEDMKSHEEFVRHIVTRLKKETRFSLDFNAIFKINQEMQAIHKGEKGPLRNKLLDHLAEVKSNMISKINYNAKTAIFDFLQTVPFFSSELFKMNLEVISRKKDLVYGNKKLIADRSRGDYSNVKRSRFEMFWTFNGAFWADELGDYSLGLKSNCQTVRKENEEAPAVDESAPMAQGPVVAPVEAPKAAEPKVEEKKKEVRR